MEQLRQLLSSDHADLLEVYRQAVASCPAELYTSQQRLAWGLQAGDGKAENTPSHDLLRCLQRGPGLVSCDADGHIAAFASPTLSVGRIVRVGSRPRSRLCATENQIPFRAFARSHFHVCSGLRVRASVKSMVER